MALTVSGYRHRLSGVGPCRVHGRPRPHRHRRRRRRGRSRHWPAGTPRSEPGLDDLLARVLPTGRLTFTTEPPTRPPRTSTSSASAPRSARASRRRRQRRLRRGRGLAPYLRGDAWSSASRPFRSGRRPRCARMQQRAPRSVGAAGVEPEFLQEVTRSPTPSRRTGSSTASTRAPGTPMSPSSTRCMPSALRRDAADRHRLCDRRAGQGRRECLSRDEDLVHQRDVRGCGPPAVMSSRARRRDRRRRADRAAFLGAGVGFGGGCLPGTSGPSWPAPVFLGGGPGADLPPRGRRDQLPAPFPDGRPGPRGARRLAAGSAGHRLGAAFKPDSDDVRDSPALDVAQACRSAGAQVVVHDPKAVGTAQAAPLLECTGTSRRLPCEGRDRPPAHRMAPIPRHGPRMGGCPRGDTDRGRRAQRPRRRLVAGGRMALSRPRPPTIQRTDPPKDI